MQIRPDVFSVGAQDWKRRIFDELIPLPDGTSYNSYLVKGASKTALIDTVDPAMATELGNNLRQLGVKKIDYLIANHAEQDHSGSLPMLLREFPEAVVVCNEKCQDILTDLLHIHPDRFRIIGDRETLDLGGKTLEFIFTPWVHWPETMTTYLREEGLIFTCDLFGSHMAGYNVFMTEKEHALASAKRYFGQIMMPFRNAIKKNLESLGQYRIDMIAPSHGPVYKDPAVILDAYREWISDSVKNEVVIAYVSMHGSTKKMVDKLAEELAKKRIAVRLFDLPRADLGEFAAALVDAATLVIASPTFLVGAHPVAAYASSIVAALRPKTRFVGIMGSYGWAGTMADQIRQTLGSLKAEMLTPVTAKGLPGNADNKAIEELAEEIGKKHLSL
jgi:flavorubredoxin